MSYGVLSVAFFMEYIDEGRQYGFSYRNTKSLYEEFCNMNDEDFIANLPSAIHLACFICWVKEIPTGTCLSDHGVIHLLVHLLNNADEPLTDLREAKEKFKNILKLV